MISRYSRPEMEQIWSIQNRFQCWLDVELAACRAMKDLGIVPEADYQNIVSKAKFDVARIEEIEQTTKHDVIAFLTNVAENIDAPPAPSGDTIFAPPAPSGGGRGRASARWLHFGMTSSDVLDTATAMQCKQAGELLLESMETFCEALKKRAIEHKNTLCIGRSHGIHAEPTSFGLKFALWYDEMRRNIDRMREAVERISVGMFSGAVGNFAHLTPQVEVLACAYLGLKPANISTQVIQRDLHSEFMSVIAIIGSTLEKIAVEIRHLQRTEVLEAEESFAKGQKGSSAMPHKKNPITSEQMSGLARLLRTNAQAALENNALWHERDISHSSVERIILPDNCILLHYMLYKMTPLIEYLKIYPENIKRNLELTHGLVFSQVLLLKLAERGMSREDAYACVQKQALICWDTKQDLRSLVESDKDLMKYLSHNDLDEVFSYDRYLKNVGIIYERVFSK